MRFPKSFPLWWVAVSIALTLSACQRTPSPGAGPLPTADTSTPQALYQDDFNQGLDSWFIERENGGQVTAANGILEIDVSAGCTVWFRPKLKGPLAIEYTATAIQAGGANDRVSDLNCFWMAIDPKHPEDLFAKPRSGKFEDYNTLLTYYVGLGGNSNTTTRFRRYIGDAQQRPLLPEHDLKDAKHMLTPNNSQAIRLIAAGNVIQYFRAGQCVFQMDDPQPYTEGWFGFRTTWSHLQIRGFRVYRIEKQRGLER